MSLFAPHRRNEVRARLGAWAVDDPRVLGAAVVGSEARGAVDRWSDIDLTFAVDDVAARDAVLAAWTERMEAELQAVALFDVERGATVYRVFLLPDALQVDVSFSPREGFGAKGPDFRLLFGEASAPAPAPGAATATWVGEAVHHALRARVAIERDRPWQAAFWIQGVQQLAISLACAKRGLPAHHGRGVDDLPADVHSALARADVGGRDRAELLRALRSACEVLRAEAGDAEALLERVAAPLAAILSP
ncbi:MAG: nucleotidyltransferase domain-containing protein [Planctomycetota bacterium]